MGDLCVFDLWYFLRWILVDFLRLLVVFLKRVVFFCKFYWFLVIVLMVKYLCIFERFFVYVVVFLYLDFWIVWCEFLLDWLIFGNMFCVNGNVLLVRFGKWWYVNVMWFGLVWDVEENNRVFLWWRIKWRLFGRMYLMCWIWIIVCKLEVVVWGMCIVKILFLRIRCLFFGFGLL